MLVFEEPWTHPNSQGTSWITPTHLEDDAAMFMDVFTFQDFTTRILSYPQAPGDTSHPPLRNTKYSFRPSTDHQGYETARSSYGEVGRLSMNGFSGRVMPGSVGAHPT